MNRGLIALGGLVVIVLIVVVGLTGTYNRLVTLDQAVQSQWAQVESVYQRRADLIPNLVATVQGAANFEKSTYVAVAEARAKVGQLNLGSAVPNDPAAFAKFSAAQDALSSALTHLLAVSENYPDLKASQNFLDLQSQLEGSENRIAVERMRFNQTAQTFNTARDTFPTVLIAGIFGARFNEKSYFQSAPGAQNAPQVKF
jgi:LemA protein